MSNHTTKTVTLAVPSMDCSVGPITVKKALSVYAHIEGNSCCD